MFIATSKEYKTALSIYEKRHRRNIDMLSTIERYKAIEEIHKIIESLKNSNVRVLI